MSKQKLPITDVSIPLCAVTPLVGEPLDARAAAELAAVFKAISDPVRLRLFSVVASHSGGEACVCDISAGFDVSQPTISHHLKVLREAGLLSSERRGSWVYYRVEPAILDRLSHLLGGVREAASADR
ncbi:ArsR/SmtB family transcription factor [Nocardia sp. CA-107356]|uniref:ArsR/SmtB family transcription factor n=1 Tax=Nocardia sp. CA-107356 TaxID=3239972 RepID=UPI003D8C15C8